MPPQKKSFVTVAQSFVEVASSWSLTVSLVKTKGMKIGNEIRKFCEWCASA